MIPIIDILGTDGSKICIKPISYTIKVQVAYSINQVHREQIKTKDLFVCFIKKNLLEFSVLLKILNDLQMFIKF